LYVNLKNCLVIVALILLTVVATAVAQIVLRAGHVPHNHVALVIAIQTAHATAAPIAHAMNARQKNAIQKYAKQKHTYA
jgi:hypothetical protein